MKYILDFDEVLFNTTALKAKMTTLGIPESARGPEVFDLIMQKDPEFDFTTLVFSGAGKFLVDHGSDCIIVSSATSETIENNTDLEKQLEFQMSKIVLSGMYSLAGEVHIVGSSKSETLQEIKNTLESKGEDLVFMDDRVRYVHEAHALGIKSILMDRSCQKDLESSDFPRICSFTEFVELVEKWS